MKKVLSILILIVLYSCSSGSIQKEEETTSHTYEKRILKAIDSGVYADFQETIDEENITGDYQLHNFLASRCSGLYPKVTEQMALTLIDRGVRPEERSFEHYKAPLRTSLERGCSPLVNIYLNTLSSEEIARFSLQHHSADFITVTEKILDREPSTSELMLIEQSPLSVDLAIQKNSELCMEKKENCEARDHLLGELKAMKEAVAKFAFHKGCVTQIEIVNTLQQMREHIEFARATGVASPDTFDQHVGHAQELRGWYNYYDMLFFKMTGESADFSQCIL